MVLLEFLNLVKNIAFILGIIVIAMIIYLYLNQNKMIYMPEVANMCTREIKDNPRGYRNPSELGLQHKEVRIKTKDNLILYGWFIYKNKDSIQQIKSTPTFIYFHENAGNLGFRLPFSELLVNKLNSNVLVVGYRGYGYSEGDPSEQGLMLDAEAILDYALNTETEISQFIDKNNIYVFGRSLGGAVALYLTEKFKPNIKGLILENTFSSMGDMVDHLFPLLKRVKNLLLNNKWPSKDRIKNIKDPIFFICSERDELVPFHHMQELYTSATNSVLKEKFVIVGGTHNESWQKSLKEYIIKIKDFINKCEALANGDSLNEKTADNYINPAEYDEDEGDDDNDGENFINEETSINKEEDTYLIEKKDI